MVEFIMVNGKKIINPLRQEVITIRSIIPGEYVANVHAHTGGESRAKLVSAVL
jgi:hypothetical protein